MSVKELSDKIICPRPFEVVLFKNLEIYYPSFPPPYSSLCLVLIGLHLSAG